MIANRFVPLDTTAAGIKARDQETAQTVCWLMSRRLDRGSSASFIRRSITVFAVVDHEGRDAGRDRIRAGAVALRFLHGDPCHPRRAAEIVAELADGVAELHARGIVHGNITQTSALLTAKGKARLSLTSAIGGDEILRCERPEAGAEDDWRPADREASTTHSQPPCSPPHSDRRTS